jgi:hypothetical protein
LDCGKAKTHTAVAVSFSSWLLMTVNRRREPCPRQQSNGSRKASERSKKTPFSLSSSPVEPGSTLAERGRLRPWGIYVQVETLTFSTIRVAERTCAGRNSCIGPADRRWISEGQYMSNHAYCFHDNRCSERTLNRKYAEHLCREKLDLRQKFRCAAEGPEVCTPPGS